MIREHEILYIPAAAAIYLLRSVVISPKLSHGTANTALTLATQYSNNNVSCGVGRACDRPMAEPVSHPRPDCAEAEGRRVRVRGGGAAFGQEERAAAQV